MNLSSFPRFWTKHPALFIGLCLLLGASDALYPHPLFALFLIFLCLTRGKRSSALLGTVCAFSAFFYTQWRHPALLLPQEGIVGRGTFHIEELKPYSSFFNHSLLYKGTLITFQDKEGHTYTHLPCLLFLSSKETPYPANTDYLIEGKLLQKAPYCFVLKPKKGSAWEELPSLPNLSQWRFDAKRALFAHLKEEIRDPQSCSLLYTIVSGEVDEKLLALEFSKVGLQHVLGVSGFHFTLLAWLLRFFLDLFCPRRYSAWLLLLALSSYYLFLGDSPAVQRAYLSILFATAGHLGGMRLSGLNALGIGLILSLLFDPLHVLDLGFQLSFLCTLAILHIYPLIEGLLGRLFLKRDYMETLKLCFRDQHLYLVGSLLRKALAVNLSVHLLSIPLLLYLFHKFPLMSVAYNLLFPAAFTLSLTLLFLGLLMTPLFPLLSHLLHAINGSWTSLVLNLTTNPPAFFNVFFRTNQVSLSLVLILLFLFFCGGILLDKKNRA